MKTCIINKKQASSSLKFKSCEEWCFIDRKVNCAKPARVLPNDKLKHSEPHFILNSNVRNWKQGSYFSQSI